MIDYKKLKKIFSNNTEVMEQVMHGLILTAHEKAPALKRYYSSSKWNELEETLKFIKSAYQHVGTDSLNKTLNDLTLLIAERQRTERLDTVINDMGMMSRSMIQDIEYYLSKN